MALVYLVMVNKYVYIYVLRHPFLEEVYIGKSSNPWRRFKQHLKDSEITPKTDWIKTLQKQAMHPRLEILERVLDGDGIEKEKDWIHHYILKGWVVVNSTNCGIGVD